MKLPTGLDDTLITESLAQDLRDSDETIFEVARAEPIRATLTLLSFGTFGASFSALCSRFPTPTR